jgi:hypothetical protein
MRLLWRRLHDDLERPARLRDVAEQGHLRQPPEHTVFETYDDIIDAACDAWNKLTAAPDVIKSIGMRQWAHIGHS